jgi:hypothetical protein
MGIQRFAVFEVKKEIVAVSVKGFAERQDLS